MEATKKKSKEWRIKNYEYDKKYKAANPDAHKRARTKWYAANREGRLAYMRERWLKDRANVSGKKAPKLKENNYEFPDDMSQA